jgi:hypothetical protein
MWCVPWSCPILYMNMYIYYHKLMYPEFYNTAFTWWQKQNQVLKCSLYQIYFIQWTLSSIQGIQLRADHKYLATWLATAWVTDHHFYRCCKVILCQLNMLIQSGFTCFVRQRWIIFHSPWIYVLQWNRLFMITRIVVIVPRYVIHCKTEDFCYTNLRKEGSVRASFEDSFPLFHFFFKLTLQPLENKFWKRGFLLNKLEQLWCIF